MSLNKDICRFVGSSYYPTMSVRAQLACETAHNVLRADYPPLIAVDEGSCDDFVEKFKASGGTIVPARERGIVACRMQSWIEGWQRVKSFGAVCFLELEKTDLPAVAGPGLRLILDGDADLVNFNRSRAAHETYPTFQTHTESAGNELLRLMTKKSMPYLYLDGFYGGRAVGAVGIPYFGMPDELTLRLAGNWGITHLPMLRMVKDGKRVMMASVEIAYPRTQRGEEENDIVMGIRRMGQMLSLTMGTLDYAEAIELVPKGTAAEARKVLSKAGITV